jgi:hypothetical protein
MDKKQTAVEWLFQRFEDGDMYNVEDAQFIKHQALAMEKQQIIDAMQPRLTNEQIDAMFPESMVERYYTQRQAARQIRDLLQGRNSV